jgi:hypothetical protein
MVPQISPIAMGAFVVAMKVEVLAVFQPNDE